MQACAHLLTDSDAKARPEHGDAGVRSSEFPEFTQGRWDYSHAPEIAGALVISDAKSSHGLCESRRAPASAKRPQTRLSIQETAPTHVCLHLPAGSAPADVGTFVAHCRAVEWLLSAGRRLFFLARPAPPDR